MPTNITPVNLFTQPVPALADGDPVSAASSTPTTQALANQSLWNQGKGKAVQSQAWRLYATGPIGSNGNYQSVAWSPELGIFCAPSNFTPGAVSTSPDGLTWTETSVPGMVAYAVAWSSTLGLFAAVGDTAFCRTSPDGVTWTSRTIPSGNWRAVMWSARLGLFVAVGSGICCTSPDGINWTSRTIPASSYYSAIAENQTIVVVVSTAGAIATSPDGINWTAVTPPVTRSLSSVTYSPALGMFAASGRGETTSNILTSLNGSTWTDIELPSVSLPVVVWCDGLSQFVALSGGFANSTACYTSTDGVKWTRGTQFGGLNNTGWNFAAWAPEISTLLASDFGVALLGCSKPSPEIGRYVTASGSLVSGWSTGVARNVASITLPPGDWDITGTMRLQRVAVTSTQLGAQLTEVSATYVSSAPSVNLAETTAQATAACGVSVGPVFFTARFAQPTTIYLVGQITFSAGTPAIQGNITARRVR